MKGRDDDEGPHRAREMTSSSAHLDLPSAAASTTAATAMSRTASFERPLRNALGIFVAHFHVRRGNEIVWSRAAPAVDSSADESASSSSPEAKGSFDLSGVEWKVLPSGSHLVERDVIYFEPPGSSKAGQGSSRVGVACFRNRRLSEGESHTGAPDEDDQRGARMIAVGTIVECGESTPYAHLAATLAHLPRLEKLADSVAADPLCRGILEEWLDMHKLSQVSTATGASKKRDLTTSLPLVSEPVPSDSLFFCPGTDACSYLCSTRTIPCFSCQQFQYLWGRCCLPFSSNSSCRRIASLSFALLAPPRFGQAPSHMP